MPDGEILHGSDAGRRESETASWLSGGGEMGKLIRSMDWSKTPLGPIDSWPQSLRTTVSLCLASNFPISLAWGSHHTQIYNDGYWPICGGKHPHSMGQDFTECWASAWPVIGEAFNSAVAGETRYLENQRMFLDRNGYLEETFFTFSFSPVRDESGGIGGLFHPVTETTSNMLIGRRTRALRDLSARAVKAQTTEEAFSSSAEILSAYDLDVPFVLLYAINSASNEACLLGHSGLEPATTASPRAIQLKAAGCGWPIEEVVQRGAAVQVDDLIERFGALTCGPYPESPNTALLIPITPPGHERPTGLFIAGISSRLPLNDVYRGFIDQLAASVTAAVANAMAREEERRRAELLAELDRAKTTFFTNVSHEFRTPLTLMLGPLEEALGEQGVPPRQLQRLEMVHRNSLRLLKLVNALLDFSRLEAGRVTAVYEPTDLAAYTSGLASAFRSAIEKAGLQLIVDCPPLPEPVFVDREMWEKIVLNLLSNAFKFTETGRITVRQRLVDRNVEVTVQDTGTGIPADQIDQVFMRFHRIEGAKGRTHEGTGIGLALVQELTRLHGGSVRLNSVYGNGSTFTVSIPLGKQHLPADRIGADRVLAATSTRADVFVEETWQWLPADSASKEPTVPLVPAARILLADDNADMREYVRKILATRYNVIAVADGQVALDTAREQIPSLVLSDVMMPRLDGFGLLRGLRADERTRAIPVILLSARAGEEARVGGLEAGADDYLIKPFGSRELLARVTATLELARVRKEIAHRDQEALDAVKLLKAERAGKETQAKLAAIIESSDDGIISKTLDGIITTWNGGAERIFGYTAAEVVRKHISMLIPPERQHEEANIQERLARGDRFEHFETVRVTKDGRMIDVSLTVSPIRNSGGTIVGASKIVRDITERKRAEAGMALQAEELARSNVALERFAFVASHDLQEPMRTVHSFAQLLQRGYGEALAGEGAEYLQYITNGVKRMQTLINDLLRYSRINSHGAAFAPADCNKIAAMVLENLHASIESNQARVMIEPLPVVIGDATQLGQMFQNLLVNAIKFHGGRTPSIRVFAKEESSEWIFSVTDNGIGIPSEHFDRIFIIFQRLHTIDEYGGTGIGLAICKNIAERHGGRMWVDSVVGEGSTFHFSILKRDKAT